MSIEIVVMGLLAGFLVGLTGVGGATLITPVLVLMGISPMTAVGTDLIYNSITKLFGFFHHAQQKTVRWDLVKRFAYGSIPGTIIAVLLITWNSEFYNNQEYLIKLSIGYVLIFAVCITLYQSLFARDSVRLEEGPKPLRKISVLLTIIVGAVLGFAVGLTSIGSGSLFAVAIMLMYRLDPFRLVGTDIAHAFLVVTAAGLFHVLFGKVDYAMVINLIIGSVPGVLSGSMLVRKVPAKPLKIAVNLIILFTGIQLIL